MGYILNLETSGTNCSVAISKGNELVKLIEENTGGFSHAEKLHVFIKQVVEQAGIAFNEVDAVAVSKGPGSYTGLRIGVSAAKGLSFAWGIPLVSVPTLKILASQAINLKTDFIIPLLDARRMEVYSAVYNNKLEEVRSVKAEVVDEASFQTFLEQGRVAFIGDGAEKCKTLIQHPNAVYVDGKFPSAKEMAFLSYEKFNNNELEDVAYFEPFYLKDFIAGKKKPA